MLLLGKTTYFITPSAPTTSLTRISCKQRGGFLELRDELIEAEELSDSEHAHEMFGVKALSSRVCTTAGRKIGRHRYGAIMFIEIHAGYCRLGEQENPGVTKREIGVWAHWKQEGEENNLRCPM
jgi:hypothetical protein